MSFVFGPVLSRRFGLSLGIDLSPAKKQCNFDCLYCELEGAKPTDRFAAPADPAAIARAVKHALQKTAPDVITITANGEPTLYPHLDALIDLLQPLKGSAKLMILSNGSTVGDPRVANALAKLDIVKLSLDCATDGAFKKLDRAVRGVEIADVINAMIDFRKRFNAQLVIEILLVKNLNDNEAEFDALAAALRRILPDRIDIGTIERPSAYRVERAEVSAMELLRQKLAPLNAQVIKPNTKTITTMKQRFDRTAIVKLLERRKLAFSEVDALFDDDSLRILGELERDGLVVITENGAVQFWALKSACSPFDF
ncbi:radical SAM protein [Campylobacterota bacterium]|nr:radical SAM protein [Campylobacterota bacterium]